MAWRIELTGEARKQLGKIGHRDAQRIRNYLRQRIEPLDDPRRLGKPLKGALSELQSMGSPISRLRSTGRVIL